MGLGISALIKKPTKQSIRIWEPSRSRNRNIRNLPVHTSHLGYGYFLPSHLLQNLYLHVQEIELQSNTNYFSFQCTRFGRGRSNQGTDGKFS
ncbi:hypothetical protein K1719_000984 [Acacia pycnantha]|nr:hypothetical protein K1719_000984 [Acacia pycnantha]